MAVTLKGQSAIYEGTSADMKPSDADKNAIFQELDTGIDYYYDGTNWNEIPSSGGGGGGTGTDDYTDLNNKPKVNNVTVVGNLTSSDLKLQSEITSSHKLSADLVDDSTSTNKFNVQADWNQTTNSAPDYIKNKPTLGTAAATDATAYATAAQGTKADSAIQTVKVNDTALTPTSAKAVNITVPTQASDINALPNTTKYAAALSLTIDSSTYVVTGQLKDQNGDNLGTAQTIDLPLESVVVGGSYDSQTKKVILTLQNGNTIEFSVADLVSGLQTELSATNKLDPSFINYDTTHAAVTESDKTTWNGKQDALTFDGTYSATNNKVATESTVSGAISALDKSSVGLDNVTNNAQVKAVSGAVTSGDIVTFGADGATVQDSGKAIETSLNDSNDKVPTSKAVRDNVAANATMSSGYAADSSEASITSSTSINDAIEQLDYRTTSNKNNISYNTNMGVKNLSRWNSGTSTQAYPTMASQIPFTSDGGEYTISYNTALTTGAISVGFKDSNGNATVTVEIGNASKIKTATIPATTAYFNIYTLAYGDYSNFMICKKAVYDNDPTYQPYAMTNAEITAWILAHS